MGEVLTTVDLTLVVDELLNERERESHGEGREREANRVRKS